MWAWIKRRYIELLLGFNALWVGATLLAYLGSRLSPELWTWPALAALAYPWLLCGHGLFLLAWLLMRHRGVYVSALCLLLGLPSLFSTLALPKRGLAPLPEGLRALSFNVQYFGTHDPQINALKRQDRILSFIRAQKPKLLCAQEFSGSGQASTARAERALRDSLGLPHVHRGGGSSLLIASAYALRDKGEIRFPASHNGAIFADIQLPQGPMLRVYCVHLQSIGLGADADEVLKQDNLRQLDDQAVRQKYKRIGSKLRRALVQRADQVAILAEHIRRSPHPVLLMGDLNDSPLSYTRHQLLNLGLKDSFDERGQGWGSTYAGSIPFLRIDYALSSARLQIRKHQVLRPNLSDHYPILVDYAW